MAATDEGNQALCSAGSESPGLKNGLMLALLSLPCAGVALADLPPERAQLSYKYLDYQDSQPDWERIGVKAHALSLLVPVGEEWSVEGSMTLDTVTGASPSYHTEDLITGELDERRFARDLKVTRYFPRGSLSLTAADSRESDYVSRALSMSGSLSSEDKNTTFSFGLGRSADRINVPVFWVFNERKTLHDAMLGISQVLGPRDILQLTATHTWGHGYYSDPYKFWDTRPDSKYQSTLLTRWNHHFSATGGTSRLSYRYYTDSFGVRAHTLGGEYVQPLESGWTLTPGIRLHAQKAASFYLDPVNPPFPTVVPGLNYQSQDQRLSAFGALSLSMKVAYQLSEDCLLDLRYERYEQRSQWYTDGQGSPGLDPLRADILQFGITHYF